jgi:hypothetical protein
MIIILPKNKIYKFGNDFPLLTIPTEAGNEQDGSFSDFQWWAYSKDFRKWLKDNPREWTAESIDLSNYSSLESYIKENSKNQSLFTEIAENETTHGRILRFGDFEKSQSLLNEVSGEGGLRESQEDDVKKAVKFHFAYNKLLSEGKIKKEISASQIAQEKDVAVFLVVENPDTGENIRETLKAYRMTGASLESSEDSKIELIDVTEMLPGGKISQEDTPESVVRKVVQGGLAIGVAGAVGITAFTIIKYAGMGLLARNALKSISGYSKGVSPTSKSLASRIIGAKSVQTLWGTTKNFGRGIKNLVTLKATRTIASSFKALKNAGAPTSTALKVAFGVSSKGAAKVGSRLIPFVGEVLMVIDAVGSAWNWFSDKQAPMYKEVSSFAKNEMDPKKIPIGVPITICWSQEAQSTFGSIVNFIANNDTRTTCELIKITERDGKSVFILTQINSKSMQKQLAEHDLILLSLDNSDIVNDQGGFLNTVARVFDNEDLDFNISYIDNLNEAASVLNFQGYCPWNEFMQAYNSASDQLIVASPNAPDEFKFYYKDPDGDHINVSGKLIQSSQLKNTDSEKIISIFFPDKDSSFQTKYTDDEKEEKIEGKEEAAESFSNPFIGALVNEKEIITKYLDFKNSLSKLHEDENEEEEKEESDEEQDKEKKIQVNPAINSATPGNPQEGTDDVDSQTQEMLSLDPKDLASPAELMIYLVTKKEYADPSLRQYQMRGSKFTNFLIDEKDTKAKNDEPITVDVNTVGGVNPIDPRRGVYVFTPDEEEAEDVEGRIVTTQPDVDDTDDSEEEKPEDIITTPDDVKIKNRKRKTIIRDKIVDDGVNLLDEFITDKEKDILGISDWKSVTFAKAVKNRSGEVDKIVLRNKYAPLGYKTKKYKPADGEKFEIAKKFIEEADQRIKYK